MKKGVTRVLAVVIVLMMVMVMVAACGSSAGSSSGSTAASTASASTAAASTTAPAKEVSFNYATFIADGSQDMVGAAYIEYAKTHPNIKMNTQVMDHTSYQEKLTAMSNSNTLPDLFWWNGVLLQTALTDAKSVVDCTPFFDDAFKSTFLSGTFAMLQTKDGKIAGFPAEMQVQAWLNNKAIFDKCGLQIPATDKDLLAAIPVLKKNGYVPIAFGTKDQWPTWGYEQWLQLWGIDSQAQQLFGDHSLKVADSGIANAFKFMSQLYTLGAFPANNSTITFEQMAAMYAAGKAAMISIPTDQLGKIIGTPVEKDSVYNWGITFTDSTFDQKIAIKMVGNGYGIGASVAKDQDKLNAIVDFNKFRFTKEGALAALKTGSNMPVKIDADLSQFSPIVQQQAAMLADDRKGTITAAYAPYYVYNSNADVYMKWATPEGTLENGVMDGSIKASDLPTWFGKLDKAIDDAITAFKAAKK